MAIKWKDVRDVLLLTTAHEDELVEAPSSSGAHNKIKPAVVLDYNKNKTGVDRSDQMLSIFKEDSKMVEETFLSSTRPGSGECTHLVKKKIKERKNVTGNFFTKKSLKDRLLVLVRKFKL